ncbi:MAG: DsbA family protein [Patescibacteria group bacterium]
MLDQPTPTIKEQRDLKQQDKERRRQAAARQGRTKTIITWSIVGLVVAGIIALIVLSGGGSSGAVAPVTDQDHVQGPRTAKAAVIEYSDFQCPACGAYYPIMNDLEQKYGDKLALVYRHYPLTQLHQYAELAAQSAEAANLQGKFWEMHDLLFERQDSWSKASNAKQTMIDYANELKLDVAKFTSDLDSTAVKDRVNRDVLSGNAVGISGTPTFFLNGAKLTNPGSADAFGKLIDAQLATK